MRLCPHAVAWYAMQEDQSDADKKPPTPKRITEPQMRSRKDIKWKDPKVDVE